MRVGQFIAYLFACTLAIACLHPDALGQAPTLRRIGASVTYVTPGTVYIGAGSKAGLQTGDTLTVVHGVAASGQIVITAISSTSSAASLIDAAAAVAIGDSVFILKPAPVETPAPPATATAERVGSVSNDNIVSGRVAMQYAGAGVFGKALDFSQPALLLRLGIDRLFGTGMVFTFYGRTYYDLSDHFNLYGQGTRLNRRIYEMSVSYNNPASPIGYTVGRLISPFLGGLGQFDGGQFFYRTGGLTAGVAAGGQADPLTSNVDLNYQKGVAFANYAWGGDVFTRSDVTLAYGQQLNKGKFDRDFLYTQASIRPLQRVMFYESSEFDLHDINNGVVVRRFHLTSAFATLSYTPVDWLTLNAGYDASRLIYLFESMKAFPDSLINRELQTGLRAGFSVRLPMRMMLFTSGTFRPTPEARNAHTLNVMLRAADIASTGINAGGSFTNNITIYTNGSGFAFDLDRWLSTWASIGARIEAYRYRIVVNDERLSTTTLTVNTNLRLSRMLYLLLNFDQIWDSLRSSQRAYLELGLRF